MPKKFTVGAVAFAMLTLFISVPGAQVANAYELTDSAWSPSGQAGWDGRWDGAFPTARKLTNTLPSGTEVSISVTGSVTNASRYWDNSGFMRLDDHGGQAGDYTSGTTVNTPAVAISNFCGSASTGAASYDCAINTLNADRGTLTISFNHPVKNPIINLSGIGGYDWRWQGGTANNPTFENYMRLWTEFELTTPNASLELLSTNGVFALDSSKKKLAPVDPTKVSSYCHWNPNWDAGCVTAQINGVGSSFTFSLDYNSIGGVSGQNGLTNRTTDDTFIVSVSVQDDYGSAPSSYDPAVTSHTVSDLRIGAGVTADALTSLNATTDSSGDDEASASFKAFATTPTFSEPGKTFKITFPVTATSAAKVCGWVDWDLSGTFDVAERQCASVSAGVLTNKVLSWVIPAGASDAAKWLRLRASYDTAGVEQPTGRLNSGEVEDYNITFAASPAGGSTDAGSEETGEVLAETGDPSMLFAMFGGLLLMISSLLVLRIRSMVRVTKKRH